MSTQNETEIESKEEGEKRKHVHISAKELIFRRKKERRRRTMANNINITLGTDQLFLFPKSMTMIINLEQRIRDYRRLYRALAEGGVKRVPRSR